MCVRWHWFMMRLGCRQTCGGLVHLLQQRRSPLVYISTTDWGHLWFCNLPLPPGTPSLSPWISNLNGSESTETHLCHCTTPMSALWTSGVLGHCPKGYSAYTRPALSHTCKWCKHPQTLWIPIHMGVHHLTILLHISMPTIHTVWKQGSNSIQVVLKSATL